jgi:plasmid stabilization system protein ParE
MKVRHSKLALAELDAILSDLAAKNPTAAQRFEHRIRQVDERIGRFPNGFQEVAERPGVRRVPLVRYPYLIFYKVLLTR